MFITNAQERVFTIPGTADGKFLPLSINAGAHEEIDSEHWNTVRKGNQVLEALVAGRFLIPSNDYPRDRPHLSNPETAAPPAELAEEEDGLVKRETKKRDRIVIDPAAADADTPTRARRS